MVEDGGQHVNRGSRSVAVLAALAVVAALYLGREVLVPIALGVVFASTLRPIVRALQRLRVPAPLGATIAVVGCVGLLVAIGSALESPLRGFAGQVPQSLAVARGKLARLTEPLRRLGAPIPAAPAPAPPSPSSPAAASPPPAAAVSSKEPVTSSAGVLGVFAFTGSFLGGVVEVFLLALFLLSAGDGWRERLARAVPSAARREKVAQIADEMRHAVTRYLVVTTLINAGQAVVVALGLWALHVPSPALWGALTFLAEFIPYLGGMGMIGLLLVVGLASEGSLGHALLPPLVYFGVTSLQNNLVSPVAYGRGLRLNPTAILVAVMFWWAVWGVAGAFLAVPILAAARILCSRVEALHGVAAFLEE